MSDVYRPPQSDVLGSGAPPPGGENLGVYPINAVEVLQEAWRRLQPHIAVMVLGGFALMMLNGVITMPFSFANGFLSAMAESVDDENMQIGMLALSALVQLLSGVLGQLTGAYLAIALASAALRVVREDQVEFGDFFPTDFGTILSAVGAQFLMTIAVLAGTCLFLVPGIILGLGLWVWPYVMMGEKLGAIDALRRSWQLTDGSKVNLLVFSLILVFGGMFLVLFTCGLGLFILIPISAVSSALIFEGLRANRPAFEG